MQLKMVTVLHFLVLCVALHKTVSAQDVDSVLFMDKVPWDRCFHVVNNPVENERCYGFNLGSQETGDVALKHCLKNKHCDVLLYALGGGKVRAATGQEF